MVDRYYIEHRAEVHEHMHMVWVAAVINGTGCMSLPFVTFPVIWILRSWLIYPLCPDGGVGERPRQSTSLTAASRSPASHLSLKEERLPAPPSRGHRAVHLQVPLGVNSKKNLRNFFLMDPFSSHFASYLSALSPSQTLLTVRHRVIRLSMGRKLWP